MRKYYKCSFCNTEWNNEKEGLECEIKCQKLNEELDYIVKKVIQKLKIVYSVDILEEKHHVSADSSNFGMNYEIWKIFNGKAKYKDNIFDFYINSDSVGDGRYEPTCDSVENIISAFTYKYINKREIKSENIIGIVEYHEQNEEGYNGDHYYRQWYTIGSHDIEELLYELKDKKIEIKVIE